MPLFEARGLTKRFGGLTAVSDVSFTIEEGEVVGLIGPNGAGKTTLFSLITGFHRADTGQVIFRDQEISRRSPEDICALGVCRTFQLVKPFGNLTVLDNVVVGALRRAPGVREARRQAEQVLEQVGLAHRRDDIARSLTVGQRKRLEVARALATRPRLLLLDEVMSGLVPTEVQQLMELVRQINREGITVLLIEHIMAAVMSLSQRLMVLHHGEKIADAAPASVARDPRVIQAYLGEEYMLAER